ncbi:LOW QUALITY PROTEIN: uncharacterized protein LOC132554269 [Ylistrum balloti]|uniref:LOW QUALITY PROTEIN: uncharacterized protein LOC132554269 n=1 Tax=Ylistrum balloti TaxID=509963 RepID=UPI002905C7AB|nr:LOW QUALITY PROTEIN: uncharacterized protein LOC132554269 [Ylistrum balloti]
MGTKRDIPAINMLSNFSWEWKEITSPPTTSTLHLLEEAQRYHLRVSDLTTRTTEGIKSVKRYVEEINEELSSITNQAKRSMIESVQIMSDLVKKLGKSISHRYQTHNAKIAKELEKVSEAVEQQQKLTSLLESVNNLCGKVLSNRGLENDDIKDLQSSIDDYGKTLETERQKKVRLEKRRKEKEEAAEKEKKREEEEKRRKDPDNWNPTVFKDDGSTADRFTNTDILCVIYAMEGSFQDSSLQCTNMEGKIKVSEWLDMRYEEQASCPISIRNVSVKLEAPMEVYVPYSINGKNREPEIKISIDNGPWASPDMLTERKNNVFPKGVRYIGTKVGGSFKSVRIVVVAVHKGKKIKVDKNGSTFTEDCMQFQVPPGFGNDNIKIGVSNDNGTNMRQQNKFLGAQVHIELDCGQKTTKDINVKISEDKMLSHCKERKETCKALNEVVTSGKDMSNIQLDLFLVHLQRDGVITTKEANDNKNLLDMKKRTKHLLEMILQRPSAAEKVLVCLDKSGNSHIAKQIRQLIPKKSGNTAADEKWRSVLVFRGDDGTWKVLDPKVAKKLQRELGCALPAGNRRFELISLTVSDDSTEKDIEEIANEFRNREIGTTVTLVCRHKADDYQAESFVHILSSEGASREITRLQEQGYTRGPMELADFNVMDGETVELYMSGNIGLEDKGRRLQQGKVTDLLYKAHKDVCKLNFNIYVVDKTSPGQMDDDRYRGLLHYRVRAREPLKERTDAVEVTWVKVSKRYLAHLSMNGDMQALGKFVSSKMANGQEMHRVFVTMDTPKTVKEIEDRVERQCKNDTDIIKYETTLFIWANQNKDEKDIQIEKILHAVKSYSWCDEARRFVRFYTKSGLFSEMSLLAMSKLLGPEWKDLAVLLKIPQVQIDYIKTMQLSEQDAKGKMLDKFRLTHYAIGFGEKLPDVFLKSLQQCKCSDELLAYVKSKLN